MISNAASRALVRALTGKTEESDIREAVADIRKRYSVSPEDLVDGLKATAHTLYPKD